MKIPLRKKRSRYEKARRALRDMMPKDNRSRSPKKPGRISGDTHNEHVIEAHEHGFAGLHWMTAGLFLAAGAEAALGERRGDYRREDAIRWAPFVAAPIAGAAQVARALWPSPATRLISRLANGIALGVGAAGLASSVTHVARSREYDDEDARESRLDRVPSLAPLAFGAVGLLGLLLDSEEKEAAEAAPMQPASGKHRRGRIQKIRIRV